MQTRFSIGLVVGVIVAALVGGSLWYINAQNLSFTDWSKTGANPPNSAEGAPPGSIHNLPVPEAVAAVRAYVAQKAGVSEGQVLIETAFEREWPDGCLGLGGPDEFCTQAIVPGWEVTAMARGESHVYRTNADGSVVREEK